MLRRFSINFAIFSMAMDAILTFLALHLAVLVRPFLPQKPPCPRQNPANTGPQQQKAATAPQIAATSLAETKLQPLKACQAANVVSSNYLAFP